MTGEETPGWLGLLRIYRYEKGRGKGHPYPIRKLATDTGLTPGLVSKVFKGTTTPSLGVLNKLIEALDVPGEDIERIRSSFLTPYPSTSYPALESRTDAQILADAIDNLADAIRSHRNGGPS